MSCHPRAESAATNPRRDEMIGPGIFDPFQGLVSGKI
jgi:hypothetical protein